MFIYVFNLLFYLLVNALILFKLYAYCVVRYLDLNANNEWDYKARILPRIVEKLKTLTFPATRLVFLTANFVSFDLWIMSNNFVVVIQYFYMSDFMIYVGIIYSIFHLIIKPSDLTVRQFQWQLRSLYVLHDTNWTCGT